MDLYQNKRPLRISSTSPNKIQPHQKDISNKQTIAKRVAAKAVRKKINESQQLSKASINVTQGQNETFTKGNNNSNNANSNKPLIQTSAHHQFAQAAASTSHKLYNHTATPSHANFGQQPQLFGKDHSQQQNYGQTSKVKAHSINPKKDTNKLHHLEEEKIIQPTQQSQMPHKPMSMYEIGPLDQNQGKVQTSQNQQKAQYQATHHKPTPSNVSSSSNPRNDSRTEDGEKRLNKKQMMRLPSEEVKKAHQQHNITRSLIEEGSEDFTNIEEHINDDTRISCRNAVVSSLNNVSTLIKQRVTSKQGTPTNQQLQQLSLRHRRGTTQSSAHPSNQPSKEETQENSSYFNEGTGSDRTTALSIMHGASPHKCTQVDAYKLPTTIFNTLVFGIDPARASDHVRESFSSLSRGAPPQQHQQQQQKSITKEQGSKKYQQQLSSQFAKKKMSDSSKKEKPKKQEKLSEFITKVDKNPIMIFDSQTVTTQQSKAQEASPSRKSQLAVQSQNLKIDHVVDQPDSQRTTQTEVQLLSIDSQDPEEEQVATQAIQQIEDFQSSELHRNHLIQTLQSLQYIKTLPPPNPKDIKQRTVRLPPPKNSAIKKTIIFDLDETLVHCIDDIENNPCDQVINVTFPNGETVQAGINVRPYAIECLRKANENYQVVVFTASHRAYADVVLDSLDPDRSLIQYRLYREHCIRTEEGIYIKDLRIISNRNLKDLIIVDNAVYSFGYQLDNGIPIIPFYEDKNDEELMHLIYYFNCLAQCIDVREQNRKAFQLKDLQEIDIAEYLQSMMQQQQ